jgi:hypothetical protein
VRITGPRSVAQAVGFLLGVVAGGALVGVIVSASRGHDPTAWVTAAVAAGAVSIAALFAA